MSTRRGEGDRHGTRYLQVHSALQHPPADRADADGVRFLPVPVRLLRAAEDDHQRRDPGAVDDGGRALDRQKWSRFRICLFYAEFFLFW